MGVLSCTAPVITAEFEEKERASLSTDEVMKIDFEMFGKNGNSPTTTEREDMRHDAQALLLEVLEEIPKAKKKDCLEAVECIPDIVERESGYVAFMRSEQYNAVMAAQRLATYWKHRRQLFRSKAFEPMTLSGAKSEERELLAKGVAMILPDDENGRPVWFLDRARVSEENIPRNSMMRVFFYHLHVLSQNPSAQLSGFIFICSLKRFSPIAHWDRILAKTCHTLMRECMPSQLMATHACYGASSPAIDLIMPVAKSLMGKRSRLRFAFHAGSDEDMLGSMVSYGLIGANLPSLMGGDLEVDNFQKSWIENNMIENECEKE